MMNEESTFTTIKDKNVDSNENQKSLLSMEEVLRFSKKNSLTDYAERFLFELQETYGKFDAETIQMETSTSESINKKPRKLRAFKALQKWRGYIEDFDDETFTARLKDLTNGGNDELFKYNYIDVPNIEKNDLQVGRVFYLSIGYSDYAGTIEKSLKLRFQKKIHWDESLIEDVADDVELFMSLPEKKE